MRVPFNNANWVAVGSSGWVGVVYSDAGALVLRVRNPSTATWSTLATTALGGTAYAPSIAAFGDKFGIAVELDVGGSNTDEAREIWYLEVELDSSSSAYAETRTPEKISSFFFFQGFTGGRTLFGCRLPCVTFDQATGQVYVAYQARALTAFDGRTWNPDDPSAVPDFVLVAMEAFDVLAGTPLAWLSWPVTFTPGYNGTFPSMAAYDGQVVVAWRHHLVGLADASVYTWSARRATTRLNLGMLSLDVSYLAGGAGQCVAGQDRAAPDDEVSGTTDAYDPCVIATGGGSFLLGWHQPLRASVGGSARSAATSDGVTWSDPSTMSDGSMAQSRFIALSSDGAFEAAVWEAAGSSGGEKFAACAVACVSPPAALDDGDLVGDGDVADADTSASADVTFPTVWVQDGVAHVVYLDGDRSTTFVYYQAGALSE